MISPLSNKKRRKVIWTPSRVCDCCGRKIVLLRMPDFETAPPWRRWVVCYFNRWDGNPWFVAELHDRHPSRKIARYLASVEDAQPKEDPVFTLD